MIRRDEESTHDQTGSRGGVILGSLSTRRKPIKELAPSGYLASVDEEKCKACGVCVAKCPFEAVSIEEEVAVIDPDGCMGCGVCPDLCPEDAIELREDSARGIPLDLQALRDEARPNG